MEFDEVDLDKHEVVVVVVVVVVVYVVVVVEIADENEVVAAMAKDFEDTAVHCQASDATATD